MRLIEKQPEPDVNTEQDFITLIREHSRLIYKVCSIYAVDRELIEDTFQDIVLNLWSAYPKFRGECKIQTWIYRIALNTCINYLRKKKNNPERVSILQIEHLPQEAQPYNDIRELHRIINKLSGIEKAFITLYLDNKSHEEIAEIMGISKGNVAVKLHRIKEKMLNLSNE